MFFLQLFNITIGCIMLLSLFIVCAVQTYILQPLCSWDSWKVPPQTGEFEEKTPPKIHHTHPW